MGEWWVDSALDEIRAGERVLKLEPRTMRLLCVLAERPGDVWSADELLERVWPGVLVTHSSVYQAIAQLRRVLDEDGEDAKYIATVPRRGYRLVAPVENEPEALSPPDHTRSARSRRWLAPSMVAVVLLLAIGAWWLRPHQEPPVVARPSIAVLPFADLSADGEYQAFCDGLSEELLNTLARLPELRVTGRHSSFQFRGSGTDTREIGRQLGVSHVIEGSVLHSGSRVRVMAQLVDTRTGFQVWSNTFDRPRTDALAVQSDISRAVVGALELQLTAQSEKSLARPAAMQVSAYDLYLLGRHQQLQRNPESLARAAEYHRQALAADPKFALAHAGLADTYMAGFYYANQPIDVVAARVQPEIDAALRLDPELAEAYAAWSVLLVEQWRPAEAIAALKRAIAINSSYSEAYLRLGYAYEHDGQLLDALASYDQVAVIDPLHTILHVRRCLLLAYLARFGDAERACDRGFELQPQLPNALWARGLLHVSRGELDRAVDRYEAALQRSPQRADIRGELATIYLDLGMPDAAARELAEVRKQFNSADFDLIEARVLLARDDVDGLRRHLANLTLAPDATAHRTDAAWLALAAGDEALAKRLSPLTPLTNEVESALMPGLYGARWSRCALCARAQLERIQGEADAAARHRRRVHDWLDGLEKQGASWHGMHYLRASLHAQEGNRAAAFESLERAVAQGWRSGWLLRADPAWQALGDDPRFARLAARIDADSKRLREQLQALAEVPRAP